MANTTADIESASLGKIVKKRKVLREGENDTEYNPIPTDTETDTEYSRASDSEGPSSKRSKTTSSKKLVRKKSLRLTKKRSVRPETEYVVTVVPDGNAVPEVPHIPQGVSGNRVPVSDDGYGGFAHEIF